MPSEKATMILQSRTDMSKDQIACLSEGEAWSIIYSLRGKKAKEKRLEICFTGFGASKKAELMGLALDHKFEVVASVTKNLDFLCGGENAGPKKLETAIAQGVQILTESEFITLIQTGELPSVT